MHWKTPMLWIFSAICPRLDSNFSNCDVYVLGNGLLVDWSAEPGAQVNLSGSSTVHYMLCFTRYGAR